MRHIRRLLALSTAVTTIVVLTVPPSTVNAQDWFRQRTTAGRTYPVTLAAEQVRKMARALQSPNTYPAMGLPLAIPDYPAPGVSSTITVPAIANVVSITVSLNIQHTYRGDLQVKLTSPGGTVFMLSDRAGGSADNIVITDQALTLPSGGAVQGGWTLSIVDLVRSDVGQLLSWSLTIGRGGVGTMLDLSMSLESNPAGDGDGDTQGTAGSEQQDKWERIIQHFADAVYEMTNGIHTIRTVRVFRSGKNSASADIRWGLKGHPHVPKNGGVAVSGGHVMMYEVFEGGGAGSSDYDMMADEEGSGHTMAHEWAHYYLGLYDEYADSCANCVSVMPSVMNSQWNAQGGNYDWLNFSIKYQGGGRFQDTLTNWQHYAYGASAWEVLARPVSLDPADSSSRQWQVLGPRVYYAELAGAAPAGTGTPRIDLPSGAARAALNILWMSDRQNVEIVIDRSGSMYGTKLTQAKAAAKLLVDQATLGQARFGVTAFDNTIMNVASQTAIDTEADRSAIKAAIDGIVSGNTTAVGEAAAAALAKLVALQANGENRVVFLLSDGQSNAGRDPLSVIPSYTAAHVPLFTFGFGADADGPILTQMATGTGGRYYFSTGHLGPDHGGLPGGQPRGDVESGTRIRFDLAERRGAGGGHNPGGRIYRQAAVDRRLYRKRSDVGRFLPLPHRSADEPVVDGHRGQRGEVGVFRYQSTAGRKLEDSDRSHRRGVLVLLHPVGHAPGRRLRSGHDHHGHGAGDHPGTGIAATADHRSQRLRKGHDAWWDKHHDDLPARQRCLSGRHCG